MGSQERKERIVQALNDVSLPAKRVIVSYPFQLSGGQLQRVSIATAMLLEPKLLIADEPTSALDWVTGTEILDLLIRLKEKTGCSILFITHDLKLARRCADQIVIMREGRILESGGAEAVLTQATHPYTQKLLAAELMLSYAEPVIRTKRGELLYVKAAVLTVQNLIKNYPGHTKAIDGISFSIRSGDVWD